MTYSVDWSPEANVQLTAVWLEHAALRQAITAAQARIDKLLAADPLGHAGSEAEGLYGLDVAPLRALYEVSETDRWVEVVAVRLRS